ncbi:MAG: septum formation initiator family protein [Candidatus Omnitrophota bacterium]
MGKKGLVFCLMILTALAIVYLPGLIELQELRATRDTLQQEVKRLHAENASLAREKELLTKDLSYVERVARRKMGVVRKGEVPYKVIVEEITP